MKTRRKIKFEQLLYPWPYSYPITTQLEVLNWMLKTGQGYEKQDGWYRYGVDKMIFGYSHNQEAHSRKAINLDNLRLLFLNALVAPSHPDVQKWRDDHGVKIGLHRYIMFIDEFMELSDLPNFKKITGFPLKKELHHPDYAHRIDPYIRSWKLCSVGNGLEFCYDFTFKSDGVEEKYGIEYSGWAGKGIEQAKDESVASFFRRLIEFLKQIGQ